MQDAGAKRKWEAVKCGAAADATLS